jgi:hypothetical protein
MTTLAAARAGVQAMRAMREGIPAVKSIQEYHADLKWNQVCILLCLLQRDSVPRPPRPMKGVCGRTTCPIPYYFCALFVALSNAAQTNPLYDPIQSKRIRTQA